MRANHFSSILIASIPLAALVGCGGPDPRGLGPKTAGPSIESPRLSRMLCGFLKTDEDAKAKFWREVDFWREVGANAPFLEPLHDKDLCLATFLFRGDRTTKRVALFGCPTDRESEPLTRFGDTGIWYRSLRIPRDARFTYCFLVNAPEKLPADPDEWVRVMKDSPPLPDPLNPQRFARVSMVECPDAPPQPWLEEKPGVARGEVRRTKIHSLRLGEDRTLTTYTPRGLVKRVRALSHS